MSLCGFAKCIWETDILFLYCGGTEAAGPTIYYVTLGLCGYLGANPNAHLSDVSRHSECSGVRKEIGQIFI